MTDEQIEALIERHVGGSELTDDEDASIRSFARSVLNAAKDCRTCRRYGRAGPGVYICENGTACTNGDQHVATQPVRLWEK